MDALFLAFNLMPNGILYLRTELLGDLKHGFCSNALMSFSPKVPFFSCESQIT